MSLENPSQLCTTHKRTSAYGVPQNRAVYVGRWSCVALAVLFLSGCSTAVAVADAVGSTIVYAGKTVVNTVDAITPDIVNDDDDD
jgi:hypothetical protein